MSLPSCDCVIVGGGVIGLTTALKLAEQGTSVAVLDRTRVGQEASWAGAGMLPPGNLQRAVGAEAQLRSLSHELWPQLAESLLEQTGIDNGYRVCGSLFFNEHSTAELDAAQWTQEGVRCEVLAGPEIGIHVADLNPAYTRGIFLPDFAQVRNPRHVKALKAACLKLGVQILENLDSVRFAADGEKVQSVEWSAGRIACERVCVTAGAWSTGLLEQYKVRIPVTPVKGQMVQLQASVLPFQCIVEVGRRYLVPRSDGLILVGSTEEHSGFDKQNTNDEVAELLLFAGALVPALREAEVVRMWAGLRPGSPDELPLIGLVPGFRNLYLAAGHYRSGLQMSPGTAVVMCDLLSDRKPAIPIDGFACDRFKIGGS